MRNLLKTLIIIISLLLSTSVLAEQKIAFIDMSFVLNNSKAGKGAQDFLKEKINKVQKESSNKEKELKASEKDLLSKKNILSKEDYKKKTDELRKEVIAYQSQRRKSLDEITAQRANARKKLIENLNPIMSEYQKENGISLIIDKKIVVSGTKDSDITKVIIEKLNKKLPSLNLK